MILDSLAATPDLDFHWPSKLAPPCYYEYYNEIWSLIKTIRRCKAFPACYDAEDRPFRIICTFCSSILIAIEDYSSTLKVDTGPTFFHLNFIQISSWWVYQSSIHCASEFETHDLESGWNWHFNFRWYCQAREDLSARKVSCMVKGFKMNASRELNSLLFPRIRDNPWRSKTQDCDDYSNPFWCPI